jgi:flagellar biosynthesis protein
MAQPPPDPTREAIALAYRQTDAAPRVVARGKGLIAEAIIARAHEHGVYVHESPELVALLTQVDIDQLAWLYRIEHGDTSSPPPL